MLFTCTLHTSSENNLLSSRNHCGRVRGTAILPGAAVLDLLISAADLSMRDSSASTGLILSSAAFVAPMALEDSAQQLARCSLDLTAGTAQLSRPHSESDSASRCASASIQRHCGATQLREATMDSGRTSAAAHAVHTQHAAGMSVQQRLTQAVPGISRDGTMLPVAPLDCTLQLSAIRSHGYDTSRSRPVLVPSGLHACKAPSSAELTGAASCPAHWASAELDVARDCSSHRLASAGAKVSSATVLEGVSFKPLRLESSAAEGPHPAGLSMHDTPEILYELCPLVVSPASSTASGAAPSVQTILQLRSHRPASAASAALVALQTLGGSHVAHRTAGQQATLLEGGDQDVEALLRTARLEQLSLDACLQGAIGA